MNPFPRQYDIEGENVCDLECIRFNYNDVKLLHEYVGPVRITLVDLLDVGYWHRAWTSACITVTNLYIAFVLATVVLFTLSFKLDNTINIHIPLCLVGFQLFMPSAILMLNPLFGPANPMYKFTRLVQHIILQVLAFFFGITGCIHVLASVDTSELKPNPHVILGYMVMFFVCVTVILGTILYLTSKSELHYIHAVAGLVTYVLSSMCVCFAILKPSFLTWCEKGLMPLVPYLLLSITILYTILVLLSVKCRVRERNIP